MKQNLRLPNDKFEVETKYGKLNIEFSSKISFPKGLIGLPNLKEFILSKFPQDENSALRILHSLNNQQFTFVTLPIVGYDKNNQDNLYEEDDLKQALKTYNINEKNLLILLIAKQKIEEHKISTYLNLKAPILLDTTNYQALQHIFLNKKYESEFLYKEKIILKK